MAQWRVRNVMTTQVVTAPDTASITEIAAVLAGRRISAVPIVDRFDVVIGVVSWTDLHDHIDAGEPDHHVRGRFLRWRRSPRSRSHGGTAADVMSTPPLAIGPDASLAAAGRAMHRRKVDRLLVTGDDGRLLGIVTRGDLLKVHGRLDAVIRDEVTQRILRRTLMIEPGAAWATVDDGLVTLTGRTVRKTTALTAVGLAEAVPGVTGVVDRMAYEVDDTVRAPASPPVAPDPLDDWWVDPRRNRPDTGATAVGGGTGDSPADYLATAAGSAALR
jgi:CBS domain-containing protein